VDVEPRLTVTSWWRICRSIISDEHPALTEFVEKAWYRKWGGEILHQFQDGSRLGMSHSPVQIGDRGKGIHGEL
jgi:hypothetical protein